MLNEDVLYGFGTRIRRSLECIRDVKNIQEIRLRVNQPIQFTVNNRSVYYHHGEGPYSTPNHDLIVCQSDLDEALNGFCDGSLYSRESEIRAGYLRLQNGNRLGLCGLYSQDTGHLIQLRSINLRLAHEITTNVAPVVSCFGGSLSGVLIAGPPGSGKTTLLRSLAAHWIRQGVRVGIADERGELTGNGAFSSFLAADVITSMEKGKAVSILLKYMTPQAIVFDEIADQSAEICDCMASGVSVLSSLHANSVSDVEYRLCQLSIPLSAFRGYVLLDGQTVGHMKEIVTYAMDGTTHRHSFGRLDSDGHRMEKKPIYAS